MSSFEKFLDKYLNTLVVLGGVSVLVCLILYFGVYKYDSSLTMEENVLNRENREKVLPVLVVLSIVEGILLLLYYKKSRENPFDNWENYWDNDSGDNELEKWRTYNIMGDDSSGPCDNADDWLEIRSFELDSSDNDEMLMNG